MDLYGVFLALGQIIGTLVGGWASDRAGFDGLFLATLLFIVIAVLPLYQLRQYEHHLDGVPRTVS
jgi:predicted MFS family arabinose efflux permease